MNINKIFLIWCIFGVNEQTKHKNKFKKHQQNSPLALSFFCIYNLLLNTIYHFLKQTISKYFKRMCHTFPCKTDYKNENKQKKHNTCIK